MNTYLVGVATLLASIAADASTEPRTFMFQQGTDGYSGFRDTTIFSEGENSSGKTPNVSAGMNKEGGMRRALVRADLSTIPPGSKITRVTLELNVNRAPNAEPPNTFELHRLQADWGEGVAVATSGGGGSGAPASAGDATWTSGFHGSSRWSSPGGDFAANASASAIAGDSGSHVSWSGKGMAADVQAWIEDPKTNFGWIIVGPETVNQRLRRFDSSEAATDRPKLTIVADVPVKSARP